VVVKTYYELLQVAPQASADEIKQAFRRTIARYHPDKVQHLGDEFQQLAQERASQITIAYKTLVDPERRAAYDASLGAPSGDTSARAAPASPVVEDPVVWRQEPERPKPAAPPGGEGPAHGDGLRQNRDELLKRAILARADELMRQALPDSERVAANGFDLGYFSKPPRLFGPTRPWMLARFLPRLDNRVLQEVWTQACRASAARKVPVCVFLLAGDLAPERDLADVISAIRPRGGRQEKVTLVPVDVRDWRAWVPHDADPAVRSLAQRFRESS
jgi:hypothetical protein